MTPEESVQILKEKYQGELMLSDYQVLASRTLPTILSSPALDLAHMALGLASEINEANDAQVGMGLALSQGNSDKAIEHEINLSEEVADMFWYLAGWCTIRKYELIRLTLMTKPTEEEEDTYGDAVWVISSLTDLAKKFFAYGKPIKEEVEVKLLSALLFDLEDLFGEHINERTLGQALYNNIAKLTYRYPQKFDADLAINRNTDLERTQL